MMNFTTFRATCLFQSIVTMGDKNGFLPFPKGFSTAAIHAGQNPEQWNFLSVVPPTVMSTTFKQHSPGNPEKYEYGRSGNPTRDVLEECLAALEGAKYGLCFASGLGAISALLGLFRNGDHIICADHIYGGTYRLFTQVATCLGITTSFIDCTDFRKIENTINSNTKVIWIESPTNPLLNVLDIKTISKLAKKHNILLAVDNTFLTPYLQRPLELGADLSVHSLTKYINGHSDIIMGAVLLNNTEMYEKLRFLQNAGGIVPSPFDCSQVNRGLKTLALRMRQHGQSSLHIAKFLKSHPKVKEVMHPGLPSHPQYELSKRQTSGHSGIVSFYINGKLAESKRFLSALKIFAIAESLGGYESLAALPFVMSHASMPEDEKCALKITENLIRLSVGLEDVEDLVDDLKQAFNVM